MADAGPGFAIKVEKPGTGEEDIQLSVNCTRTVEVISGKKDLTVLVLSYVDRFFVIVAETVDEYLIVAGQVGTTASETNRFAIDNVDLAVAGIVDPVADFGCVGMDVIAAVIAVRAWVT